jgi:hypothetical protein
MQRNGETISNVTETIDGNQYVNCRFENCQLVFSGGELPTINSCHFDNCRWQFEEAAERTLLFMKNLYHGMGPGGVELIEATLNAIREPIVETGA